jgi:protein subunit release factor A
MLGGSPKRLLFSITAKDFDIQTFSVGGHGGGGKDTSNSGVRLIHRASGARGEGREARSNTLNRRSAFEKLTKTKVFQDWLKIEAARRQGQFVPETPEQIRNRVNRQVDEDLKNGNILIEEFAA